MFCRSRGSWWRKNSQLQQKTKRVDAEGQGDLEGREDLHQEQVDGTLWSCVECETWQLQSMVVGRQIEGVSRWSKRGGWPARARQSRVS